MMRALHTIKVWKREFLDSKEMTCYLTKSNMSTVKPVAQYQKEKESRMVDFVFVFVLLCFIFHVDDVKLTCKTG